MTKLNAEGSALVYSTYLGGSNFDSSTAITVNAVGNAYITGFTFSTDFPTQNPWQPTYGGGTSDAFVTKLDLGGTALVYSTYLGGSNNDTGYGIAVDATGNAYVTGGTFSSNFPKTNNAFQRTYQGTGPQFHFERGDAFVTKLDSAGVAAYSTYLGGSGGEDGFDIAVDSAGDAYITGWTSSTDFPTTPGAFDRICGINGQCNINPNGIPTDAFVTKVNAAGSALIYSTYLGGNRDDVGNGIAVDAAGNAYVTGSTSSDFGFPTKDALQPTKGDFEDAFVTKINPAGYRCSLFDLPWRSERRRGRQNRTRLDWQCLCHWGNQVDRFSDKERLATGLRRRRWGRLRDEDL